MISSETRSAIGVNYQQLAPCLNEKARRVWAASEALSLGRGGVSAVVSATGLSRATIHTGLGELKGAPVALASDQVAPRWWSEAADGQRPDLAARFGVVGGTGHARGSAVAFALDLREYGQTGR